MKPQGSKYVVIEHPIERKIIEFIEMKHETTSDELWKYFMPKEANDSVLKDLYLEILEIKGKIKKTGTNYRLMDINEELSNLKKDYNQHKEIFAKKEYKNFCHYYITKKRGQKLLFIDLLDQYISDLYNEIQKQQYSNSPEYRINILLCQKLIKQFDLFKVDINKAEKEAKKLNTNITEELTRIQNKFDDITEFSSKNLLLEFKDGRKSIKEYGIVIKYHDEFEELYLDSSKEIIIKIKDNLSKEEEEQFHFRIPNSTYYYKFKILMKLSKL